MTTTLLHPDHEDQLLGRLGASEPAGPSIDAMIDADLALLRSHGCDAFTQCGVCEDAKAEILRLRKEQRMARGDFIGAQRLMR